MKAANKDLNKAYNSADSGGLLQQGPDGNEITVYSSERSQIAAIVTTLGCCGSVTIVARTG
jgi:hypothetical protein